MNHKAGVLLKSKVIMRADMEDFDKQKQWSRVYRAAEPERSLPVPFASLDFVLRMNIPIEARIIDVGGGDSLFVDHLIYLGYQDLTVVDISEAAIDRAKKRLSHRAEKVKWIVADSSHFVPTEKYDLWHDRTFHLLAEGEIEKYIDMVQQSILPSGILMIGTFSKAGEENTGGRRYSEATITGQVQKFFQKIKCISIDHKTPLDTLHNFIFCSFRKMAAG